MTTKMQRNNNRVVLTAPLDGKPWPEDFKISLKLTSDLSFIEKDLGFPNKRSRAAAAAHCAIQIYQTPITKKVRISIHFSKPNKMLSIPVI